MDNNIYNLILNNKKYKDDVYLIRDKRKFFINILDYSMDTYKYILLTTGFHDINNIYNIKIYNKLYNLWNKRLSSNTNRSSLWTLRTCYPNWNKC